MGQLLAQAEPVKLVAYKLPRADAMRQVSDADLVGQGEEGAGHLLIAGVIYNERGQMVTLDRAPGGPDMNLTYY